MSLDLCLLFPPGYGFDEINTQPVITVPGAQSVNSHETLTFEAATLISIADAEDHEQTVTLAVSHGTLTLSQTTGLSFDTGDGTADATMTFTGSLANVNAALDGLIYDPTDTYEGSDTLTINATDALGVSAVQKTVAITVTMTLLTGLVAYFKCEEGSGNLVDAMGSYDLTASGSPGGGTGIINDGRTLASASSQYFSGALPFPMGGKWTLDFWVKTQGTSSLEMFICGRDGSNFHVRIFRAFGNNNLQVQLADGAVDYTAVITNAFDPGVGKYIRVDYDEGVFQASVNNGTPTAGSGTVSSAALADDSYVGQDGDGNWYVNSTIDEIGLWNRLLSTAHKAERYNSGALDNSFVP